MAEAAREAGAEVRTDAAVERVLISGGRATGVELADGEEMRAERVLSNADPKTTFLGLVGDAELPPRFVAALRAYRCEGTSVKINLAVDELPVAAGDGRRRACSRTIAASSRSTRRSPRWTRPRPRPGRDARRKIPTSSSASRLCTTPRSPPTASTW